MNETGSPRLEVENLVVEFGAGSARNRVLNGVTFTVHAGEKFALVGESGSGKSTTGRALLGLLSPHGQIVDGAIRLNGLDLTRFTEREWAARRGKEVALIPQDPMLSLDPTMRVGRQIAEGLRLHRIVSDKDTESSVLRLLLDAGFDHPESVRDRFPHQLSGGMRQRVLIAMAWASQPQLVVADEPTSALDVTVQRSILNNIDGRIAESGASMILITHDLGVAADRSDRIAVMQGGEIVETGRTLDVLADPQHSYTRHLIADNPRASDIASARAPRDGGARVLFAVDLKKRFHSRGGGHQAVAGVSIDLRAGRTLGIVGESGSGKSTTARLLVGLEIADSGTVEICGRTARYDGWRRALPIRRDVQMVFQDTHGSLDPRQPVWLSIAEPLRVHGLVPRVQRRRRAEELMELVHLDPRLGSRTPGELSGGQRQRIAIARALAVRPQVLVCDEAVSALDVTVQAQILRLFDEIQERTGVAIVFISHDLGVVSQIADDVLVMRQGVVVESGDAHEVFSRPAHEYTRELLSTIPGRSLAPHPGAG
jgi:peptide/nickel transport system ATP-binding protein